MGWSEIELELEQLESQELRRKLHVVRSPQDSYVIRGSQRLLSFCSNDYLGLANHPEIIGALRQGARLYGVGAGGSHLVCGHMQPHVELEQALSECVGQEASLLFGSGYLANLGIMGALASRHTTFFADRLNHASLNEGALLLRAKLVRYQHMNLSQLSRLMSLEKSRQKIVATDAVFSMDGDRAPLEELSGLCAEHDAWLIVDDAHGFGLLNAGRGSLYGTTLATDQIVYMATLSKALGGYGAFVAGRQILIDYLVQKAKSYIYTTAMPPAMAYAMCHALQVATMAHEKREHLSRLIQVFREGASTLGWELLPSDTPIQPVMMQTSKRAMILYNRLLERGILVPAIR
ncbi:MAG: 8-amino-7-oxononanoate synthase, partial [Pseudomonadota bacterium]|nr:8-amino-7-oxononanoate synthase [Pseudomonadota bacterium]